MGHLILSYVSVVHRIEKNRMLGVLVIETCNYNAAFLNAKRKTGHTFRAMFIESFF